VFNKFDDQQSSKFKKTYHKCNKKEGIKVFFELWV